jgi:lipopolysaccharide export system permease protein
MLWAIAIPVMALAIVLSEFVTPAAEIRFSEANMVMRGKVQGGRLVSGYWFKEPTESGGSRVINVGQLLSSGEVADISIYELDANESLSVLRQAKRGTFEGGQMVLSGVTDTIVPDGAVGALADGQRPTQALITVREEPERMMQTSLTPGRIAAKIATPERMSLLALWDYIGYLKSNQLDADRQIVAVWRKLAYPFTLIVMLTIAAPVSYMQTRAGGVGAKMFIGILVGTSFFMISQLTLNVGTLYRWPPIVTALLPSTIVFLLALGTVLLMERRRGPKERKPSKLLAEKSTA